MTFNAFTQQYLLVQIGNKIKIVDYDSKEEYKGVFGFYFKNEIMLYEDSLKFSLAGYNVRNDTLDVYIEKSGKIFCLNFINVIFKNLPYEKKFSTKNLLSLYDINSKDTLRYFYKDIIITYKYSALCKITYMNNIVFERIRSIRNPILCPDEESVMFQTYKGSGGFLQLFGHFSISEINVKSGKITKITRKGYNPSYSPKGNIIMYYKEPNSRFIRCYDKKTGKNDFYSFADKAFWLFK